MIKYICPCCESHFRLNEFQKYDDGSKTKEAIERAKRHQEKKDAFAKRNSEIYDKRQEGRTFKDLGKEYGITAGRIRDICQAEPIRRARRNYELTDKDKLKGLSFGSAMILHDKGIRKVEQIEPWLNAMNPDERHQLVLSDQRYREILSALGLFIDPTTKKIERINEFEKKYKKC